MALQRPELTERERKEQRRLLQIIIGLLLVGSIAVAVLPRSLPLSTRLLVSGTDLLVAGVMFAILRQKFPAK